MSEQSATSPSTAVVSSTASDPRFAESYAAALSEIEAIPEASCIAVTLDVQGTSMTVLGTLPDAMALRQRIVDELPRFAISRLDRLDMYAGAAWHAHTLYQLADKPPATVQAMAERGSFLRDLVTTDIQLLMKRELLPAHSLEAFQGTVGYRAIASDLTLGANLLRTNHDLVKDRTTITASELDELELLARHFVKAAAERDQSPVQVAEAALRRQRAYTLMVRSYDQVRRAIGYLLWDEGDADAVVPSLWAGRNTGRKKTEPTPVPPTPQPPAPVVTPMALPLQAGNGAAKVAVGMPQSDPFLPS